ncbi:MAG: hypothetical protein HOO85_02940 [Methylotenera sp.]|nr:hypothetical protein [Methylotenera sp.]
MLYAYIVVALFFATWMGWHMRRTLDRFDWAYRRSEIWVSFGLKTIFWLPMMLFKPSELITPEFGYRPSMLNIDFAEITRQRVKFMENPPPCSSTVTYRTFGDDSKSARAFFYFSSASVETMAKEINQNLYKGLLGMNGAALWTSLRTESVTEPTEVPELLVNFDHIADGLIEAGHGQVRCMACNKTYTTTELTRESGFIGGWLLAHYSCPARHWLLSHEIAHFMFKRNDDE